MSVALSAVVCAHDPRRDLLDATLEALRAQTLDPARWEFLLVDNASADPLAGRVGLDGLPRGRHVREARIGLALARLRAYREAAGAVIVFVDDDNVLDPGYLEAALARFEAEPDLGACGGRTIAAFEAPPPPWFDGLGIDLACRDLGDDALSACWTGVPVEDRTYPRCAPVGAGLAVRREAFGRYVEAAASDPLRTGLGRAGRSLASGEDNDIVMSVLEAGWRVAYCPELRLEHHIPAGRVEAGYLARIAYGANRTWPLVLDVHGIRPWGAIAGWTAPLRKARAYVREGAWRGGPHRVRWRAACGLIDGRALLP